MRVWGTGEINRTSRLTLEMTSTRKGLFWALQKRAVLRQDLRTGFMLSTKGCRAAGWVRNRRDA